MGGRSLPLIGGPSNRPTASRPLYCATFLGTCAHLCARTARVLGLITLLLLGCAAWAAALAASIATTLDATSPATAATAATAATTLDATSPITTAESSAGTSSEQPVTADGFQPAAAMAHLGPNPVFPSSPQKDEGRTAFESIHRQHESSPDLPRSMLVVLGNGWRDGDTPTKGWVKWAISKERSDAAAHQNETQRRFHYAASAPAHEQLLTSKRAALQAAMQEQLDLAWEQHAAQHQLDCHHCSKWET
ncbi:hypothetical protein V8C86DRAFT_2845054 [Haematococcus lacustris]